MTDHLPLRLIPLGGLGEIGMNCMAIHYGRSLLVVDCGVTFPPPGQGVDVIHPRLDYLIEHRHEIDALVVTHGHEDHIGAVGYLLGEVSVPVYGPPYALALIENRLEEVPPREPADLRPIAAGRSFGVGPFEIEPFHVNHSIPNALGLILRTPAGVVVHTGDYKIEDEPLDGRDFPLDRLRALGDAGVRLLLSDSTNADIEGRSGEELDVAEALEDRIREAPHRVVVAIFASNVGRMGALFEVARRTRRKVCLLGRSVQTHTRIGRKLGHLPDVDALLVSPEAAKRVPRDQLMVIATGTQGEPPAALSRLARDAHPDLSLEPGDTVLLSSRIIPGSEVTVFDMVNTLERRGVTVMHQRVDRAIHVSGHACRDEQRMVMEAVRPDCFLPVHGTYYHLRHHAELAREVGVPQVVVVENGAILELDREGLRVVGQTPTGRVHRQRGVEISDDVLRERSLMASLGLAFVAIPLDPRTGMPGVPTVRVRGYSDGGDIGDLCVEAERYVRRSLERELRRGDGPEDIEDCARRALKRFFRSRASRSPLVMATALTP